MGILRETIVFACFYMLNLAQIQRTRVLCGCEKNREGNRSSQSRGLSKDYA
jgi:hypothetical protein